MNLTATHDGTTATRTTKVAYTHARFTGPIPATWGNGEYAGQYIVSWHKSEKAAATGAHQTPAWNVLGRTVVPVTEV